MLFPNIIKLFCYILITNYYASAEEEADGTVYSCCHIQNTFRDGICESCIANERFLEFSDDIASSHQDLWKVPETFLQNQTQIKLRIETRNASKERYCESFRIKGKFPSTTTMRMLESSANESFVKENKIFPLFLKNGSMIYKDALHNPIEYCIDRLLVEGEFITVDISALKKGAGCDRLLYKISYRNSGLYVEKWINQLFAAVSGLSCLFTILNIIIYLSLRNYLNVSGWIEFTYFLALGVFCGFSISAFLYEPTSDDIFCYLTSVILQFSEIMVNSSYIIIAFDVYWMLRKSDTFASYGEEIGEAKLKLVIYLVLLSVVPIGVTVYGIVLNQESISSDRMLTVPHYGEKSCFAPEWLLTEYLGFAFESATFFIVLLSVNHVFGRLSASTDIDDAPRVSLLSNMFFFTLCYWITDLLKFARPLLHGAHSQNEINHQSTFWIALDGFTYAQGILSFVVFIFNRKTLKAFRKKAGTDGGLRAIFRHACCGDGSGVNAPEDDGTPMSPLMKRSGMKRSTVRRSVLY